MNWKQKMEALPIGYSAVRYEGKKYGVTRINFNGGKSIKVYAKELGGKHFISFNYYFTAGTGQLKPCEMPERAVIHFLEHFAIT